MSNCENCSIKDMREKYKECQEREKLNYEAKDIMQRQRAEINKLKEQLEIAVETLKFYAHENSWVDCRDKYNDEVYKEALFFSKGYEQAQRAVKEIEK